MSDVQPMLYIEDLERGIAFYRDQLGFDVTVFGHQKETGAPLIARDPWGVLLVFSNGITR